MCPLAQAFSGLTKMVVKASEGRNVHAWHGLTGMGIYALCMATVVTGYHALMSTATALRVIVTVRLLIMARFCAPPRAAPSCQAPGGFGFCAVEGCPDVCPLCAPPPPPQARLVLSPTLLLGGPQSNTAALQQRSH